MNHQILTPTDELPERVREQSNDFVHLLPRYRQGPVSFEAFDRRNRVTLEAASVAAERIEDDGEEEFAEGWTEIEDPLESATAIRVRRPSEKRDSSEVSSKKARKEGKGVQADARKKKTEASVKKARSRKKGDK